MAIRKMYMDKYNHPRYKVTKKDFFLFSNDPNERYLDWWEKDPVKYAISHPGVKTRLEMLMNSNIVRLTDRKYMTKFMAKLRESHEKQQQRRIEERKKQELMRTKHMILNRFIPVHEAPIEIRQYPLFKLYLYFEALNEKKNRSRALKKIKMPSSLYDELYPKQVDESTQREDELIYVRKIYDGDKVKMIPLTQEEVKKFVAEKSLENDIENGFMMSQEDYDRLHYEAEGIKTLREAETVEELYRQANDIIGQLYSHAK